MPLSSNAPFSEFGQSMILRDIEQLYLITGGGQAPSAGSVGEGGAQESQATLDQTTQGGGGPASPVTTGGGSSNLSLPVSIANGGTGAATAIAALSALGAIFDTQTNFTGNGTFTAAATGRVCCILIGGGGGGSTYASSGSIIGYVAPTSGGSPTNALYIDLSGGGGGGGAIIVAIFDVTAGEQFTVVVGTGGATGFSTGSAGTASSVKDTATAGAVITLSAGGGQGGYGITGSSTSVGRGGEANSSVMPMARHPLIFQSPGGNGCGPDRTTFIGSPGTQSGGFGGAAHSILGLSSKGGGGRGQSANSVTTAQAGSDGAVIFLEP